MPEGIFLGADKRCIMVHSDYSMKEFWKSLLGREWSRKVAAWTFPATPASAALLYQASSKYKDKMPIKGNDEYMRLLNIYRERDRVMAMEDWPQPKTIRTDMWQHQRNDVALGQVLPGHMLHAGMGTGKSASFVGICGELDLKRVLIIAPKKPMSVWPKQFRIHSTLEWSCTVLNQDKWSVKRRMEYAQEVMDKDKYHGRRSVIIMNYDVIWRDAASDFILDGAFQICGMDEIHRIKSPGSNVSKFAAEIPKYIPRVVGMTGTMLAHSPLDCFGQLRAVDAGVFGKSYHAFKSRYSVLGGFGGKQILSYKNKADMKSRIDMVTLYVDRDKVLDLPEEVIIDRVIEMSHETLERHQQMERDFYLRVESGEIKASNALAKLLKLAQISDGFIIDGDKKITSFSDEKKQEVKNIVDDAELPVVVFCRFTQDLVRVAEIADEMGLVYGEVSGSKNDLAEDGTILPETELLGVQIQAGSEGTDFTAARVAIIYSFGFSLKDWKQCRARLHRPGQVHKVSVIRLVGDRTVDVKIYKSIDANENIVHSIMNDSDLSSKYDDEQEEEDG